MYNSPHFKAGTFTLACVLLLSSSGSHLLYADNDPCFRRAICPNAAKPRTAKVRRPNPHISSPRPSPGNRAAVATKKPGRRNSPQSRVTNSLVASNESFVLPPLPSAEPAVVWPLSRNSVNSGRLLFPLSRTEDTGSTVRLTSDIRVETPLGRGYQLFNSGKHSEAKKQFEAILKVSPNNMQAHNGIGDVHMVKGRHSKAIEAYRKALSLDPQNTALYEKFQRAIAIEKERDNVVRDKWIIGLLQIAIIGAGAAVAPRNSEVKPLQYRNRPMAPLNQP